MATAPSTASGSKFTEDTVVACGFTNRYFEAGAGDPLVVLNAETRLSIALDILAERRRVILLAMPGFGDEPNDRHQNLAELAEAVAEAIAELGLQKYHLLGTSLGGAVALEIALAHPERLNSLVLEAPATFRVGSTSPASPEFAAQMPGRVRRHPERLPVWEPPDPAAQARVWPLVERVLVKTPEYDDETAARLAGCQVRTLVVFGNEDGVVPPDNGATFRRLMPNCNYVLVHQAAHDIQGDRPEAFADLVGDFLDRGLSFLVPQQSTLINP